MGSSWLEQIYKFLETQIPCQITFGENIRWYIYGYRLILQLHKGRRGKKTNWCLTSCNFWPWGHCSMFIYSINFGHNQCDLESMKLIILLSLSKPDEILERSGYEVIDEHSVHRDLKKKMFLQIVAIKINMHNI